MEDGGWRMDDGGQRIEDSCRTFGLAGLVGLT